MAGQRKMDLREVRKGDLRFLGEVLAATRPETSPRLHSDYKEFAKQLEAAWQRQDAEIKELEEKIEKREKAVQRLQEKACAQILDSAKTIRVGVSAATRGEGKG